MSKVEQLLQAPAPDPDYPFKLIGRRHLRSNNSWMHNLPTLKGGSNRCTAKIHPEDAKTYDLVDGELIEVKSAFGSIQIEAELTKDIIPGTISIPHGWGHRGKGIQLKEAQQSPGVNINELMDHNRLDGLSHNAAFSGQPVAIAKLISTMEA